MGKRVRAYDSHAGMTPSAMQIPVLGRRHLACILLTLLVTACGVTDKKRPPSPAHTAPATAPQKITLSVLGASGMVGGYILDEALRNGYAVRALARTPEKLERYGTDISIVQGDARNPEVIRALLRGSDVVISALGPVKSDGDAAQMISTTTTRNVLDAMAESDITRYILVSGAAVVVPGDSRNLTGHWMRMLVKISMNNVLKDKQAEYELLAGSTAQWTLVRCPLISQEAFLQPPRASLSSPTAFNLRAGELARFVIEQIKSDEWVTKAPFLESR